MPITTEAATLLVRSIVQDQQLIMGPLAIAQANKVNGLIISSNIESIEIKRDPVAILTDLVKQYQDIFGTSSLEVCKESIKQVATKINTDDIPQFLR